MRDEIPTEFRKGLPNTTKEEMNAVALRASEGDMDARHRLGEMMQPFVIGYVRTIKGDYTRDQRNEITQSAWLGVAEALSRWDSSKEVKFNTYAHFWIKGEVNKWLAGNSGVLPLPRTAWVDAAKVEAQVRERFGEEVPATEIPDDLLASMEITTLNADNPRRFKSAGAAFRARQQAYEPGDPDWEPSSTESAEDIFFRDTHDLEQEALDVLRLCTDHIANGREWLAEDTAAAYVHKHNLREEIAANIIEQARTA